MAALVWIYRFDGPPPPSPDDPCLTDDPALRGLVPPNPARAFHAPEEIRLTFDRHVPGIRWNERGNGFFRRGKFRMHVLLPDRTQTQISLAIDDYTEAGLVLRRIEADKPQWYTSWFDGKWLRDTPLAGGC